MQVNGVIEASELLAFKACYQLAWSQFQATELTPTQQAILEKVKSELAALNSAPNYKKSLQLTPQESKDLLNILARAHQKLKALDAGKKAQLHLTPARLSVYADVVGEFKKALDEKQGVSLTIEFPPKKDLTAEKPVRDLMIKFKMLREKESFSPLFKGGVVGYKQNPHSNQLIVVQLDPQHSNTEIQKRMRDNIILLYIRNFQLSGKEGGTGEIDFFKKYQENPTLGLRQRDDYTGWKSFDISFARCVEDGEAYLSEIDEAKLTMGAWAAAECLLGRKIKSFGLEDPDINQKLAAIQAMPSNQNDGDFNKHMLHHEFVLARGTDAIDNLFQEMARTQQTQAQMVYGMGHEFEIRAKLDTLGVNYIIIDPRI